MKIPKVKINKKVTKILIIVGGVLIVIVLVGYLSRGWIRTTVGPKMVTATYGKTVKNTANAELANSANHFRFLAIKTWILQVQNAFLPLLVN